MKNFSLPRPVTDDEISGEGMSTVVPPSTCNMYANSELLPEEKLRRVGKLVEELRDDFEYINLLPHGEYTGIITPKRSNS